MLLLLTESTVFYWNIVNERISYLKDACSGTDNISAWVQGVQEPTITFTGDKRAAGTNVDVVDNMPPAKRMKTVIVHEEELPVRLGVRSYNSTSYYYKTQEYQLGPSCQAWRVVYEGKLSLKRCIDAVCPAEWTGMWQSRSILQTFAAHLDYTRGCVPIEAPGCDEQLSRIALALSAAAAKRALHLLSTGEMSFEVTTAVAKGKRKVTRKSEAQALNNDLLWKVIMRNNEDFSESLWGYDSQNMLDIVKSAERFMATATDHIEINSVEDMDEEYVDLLDFR
ncbi:hypothetical protein EV424DRAFT_1347903 [Suillus variegatus]|nr:hypothetical protein EV424DRAFT_1347903 [Suillus variegatus]